MRGVPLPQQPGLSQERSQRRREQLLQAATAIIAESGARGLTHRAVSARAGLPPSAAGYYFSTSKELLAETLRHYGERRIAVLSALVDTALAEASGLLDFCDRVAVAVVPAEGAAAPGLAQFDMYLEAARSPELRPVAIEVTESFERLVAEKLSRIGIPDPVRASRAFMAAFNGFALNRIVAPQSPAEEVALLALALRALLLAMAGPDERARLLNRVDERGER